MEFQPSGSPALSPASTPKGLRQSKQQTDCHVRIHPAIVINRKQKIPNPPKH